jgi:ATP-dependent helicase/nuclease subunit A
MTDGATLDALLNADRKARSIAQSEFTTPVVLEAGAGTGKTTTLVARVLAWTLGDGWEAARHSLTDRDQEPPEREKVAIGVLEGVVSITFTEAAAAEMESRIAEALSQVAAGRADSIVGFEPPAVDRSDRAHALLAELDHLTVRTIHAYCLNLLKRHPLEAGLHPELTVDADGRVLEELVTEIVENDLRSAYTSRAEGPLIQLARREIGPRRIAEALRQLAERGFTSAHLREDPFDATGVAEMRERLRGPLSALLELVGERFASLPRNQKAPQILATARATLAELDESAAVADSGLGGAVELCSRLREGWPENYLDPHLKRWRSGKLGQREAAALGDSAADLPVIAGELHRTLRHFLSLDPETLDQARRALVGLLARIETEMRSRGVITFNGLLHEARRLLAEAPAVRRRERNRLSQLLVDEFQDTDRQQTELVRLLALTGPRSKRPGLFVVGDPKQSIYGWRNADLEAYEAFLQAAARDGGQRFSLVENFRSAGPILAEVDRTVAPAMTRRAGLQPAYERLLPCPALADSPGFVEAERAPVEMWISWADEGLGGGSGPKTHVDDAARLEAEAVAADIAELHSATDAGWSDFAVLLRSGNRLDHFLTAFRNAGVPFAVARDKNYFRRREVIEAAALIRAVVNPVDHLALLTYLRSPAVGVPDAALIPLWRHRFPDLLSEQTEPTRAFLRGLRELVARVATETPREIPGIDRIKGWERSLLAGTETLLRLRSSFATDPPDRFIEHVRSWLLLEATESARYLGSFRVANLERFLRQLESALELRDGDIQAVLRNLRRAVAEAREAEEALPKEAALDAVQILTIHAAKGLEFRHVYLAQLHAPSGGSDNRSIDADERWEPGERLEYRLFTGSTPGLDRVVERRRRVEQAERVRLLYVAMTRARERLVLLGKWPEAPQPDDDTEHETFLDLLQQRQVLPKSIAALLEKRGDDQSGVREAEALWRFPGYRRAKATAGRRPELPSWLPAPHSVKNSAEHLRALSISARERMERPFHQAATHEVGERLEALALESASRSSLSRASREAAMQIGTAIHRLFETWNFDSEPEAELARQSREVNRRLRAALTDSQLPEASTRAESLLGRIAEGHLLKRFLALEGRIVARELPVVLPPREEGVGPVGFLSGAIDLVYRSDRGSLVIVDFKTDAVELDLEIETRAAEYAAQEIVYAQALSSAFGLDQLPARELWFLWPDRLHEIAV